MTISENIKQIRKRQKISQKKLAKMTGLSVSSIQGYEYGDFKPKYEAIQKIADALSVDPSEIDEGLKPKAYDTPEEFERDWSHLGGGAHPKKESKESQLEKLIFLLNDSGLDKVIEYTNDLIGNEKYRR